MYQEISARKWSIAVLCKAYHYIYEKTFSHTIPPVSQDRHMSWWKQVETNSIYTRYTYLHYTRVHRLCITQESISTSQHCTSDTLTSGHMHVLGYTSSQSEKLHMAQCTAGPSSLWQHHQLTNRQCLIPNICIDGKSRMSLVPIQPRDQFNIDNHDSLIQYDLCRKADT